MTSYDDWATRSDGDEPEVQHGRGTVTVQCLKCEREMDVAIDDRPPYVCAHCWTNAVERATAAGRRAGAA